MSKVIVYRNCFTGDQSGGDKHMVGVCMWLSEAHPGITSLVHAKDDGQDQVYSDMDHVTAITYKSPKISPVALMYTLRALLGIWRVRLHYDVDQTVLLASSHFLPDVVPVFFKGKHTPNLTRGVYIHHIVQDMDRSKSVINQLAAFQEKVCFALIRRRFDKIIVVNQAVAKRLRKLGFTKQQVLVSSNFVDMSAISGLHNYAEKDITIAFCGRFVAQKGIDDFIAVCRYLQKHRPDFNAVMIGTGPEYTRIKELIRKEHLSVNLVGAVDDTEKFRLLSRSKLFVFPSVEEGWGIVIAEAFATATPAVVYDLPVYSEVFGDAPHKIPTTNTDRFAQEVSTLLQAYDASHATYETEQNRLIALSRTFARDLVAQKEYSFLVGGGVRNG